MTTRKITPAELDAEARCECCPIEAPRSDVVLRARCHPSAPLVVRYSPNARALLASCPICGESALALDLSFAIALGGAADATRSVPG